jgi:hypothetical protein
MSSARTLWLFLVTLPLIMSRALPATAGPPAPSAQAHQASIAQSPIGNSPIPSCAGPCVATTPSPSLTYSQLSSVAAVSASDVWAVGSFLDDTSFVSETLIEHYTGASWSVVPSPNPSTKVNELLGVSATGPDDVWAVGVTGRDTDSFDLRTLAEHWDGATWTIVPTPTPSRGGQLNAVAALSPTDVWAVGGYSTNNVGKTLVLHYDGTSWTAIASPSPSSNESVLSGAAASSGSVWAVGHRFTDSGVARTLVEHYDGTSWSKQASANRGTADNQLASVSALSPSEAWAVGTFTDPTTFRTKPLIEHFVAGVWQRVPAAVPTGFFIRLGAVAAASATDVWAVGDYSTIGGVQHSLVEHFDGSGWTIVPSQDPSAQTNALQGVWAISASDVWAIGFFSPEGRGFTLAEHDAGTGWTVVATPNGDPGNALFAVAGSSATDLWAVGAFSYPATSSERAFAEHYDGSTWQAVHAQSRGVGSVLSDVTALSASDAWTVGSFLNHRLRSRTLIEHWDGSGWSVIPSPSPGATSDNLLGVVALGPSDVWAVGTFVTSGFGSSSLVEHYDGTSWSVVSSPNGGSFNTLFGIGSSSATDLWTVGNLANGPFPSTLAEHGDGTTWTTASTPNPSSVGDRLFAVAALSSANVWAVGSADIFPGKPEALVERYNGTSWKSVSPASLSADTSELLGVAGSGASDVWAVGDVGNARGATRTLIERFDGASWLRVTSPYRGGRLNILSDVVALSATDAWAVGRFLGSGGAAANLIEHFDGVAWSVVHGPNP